jgi:hypothetical protein
MTGSSSKLLQIQGKWYQERKQKKTKPGAKKTKTILHPFDMAVACDMAVTGHPPGLTNAWLACQCWGRWRPPKHPKTIKKQS